jgi:hypothetical protein
VSSKCLRQCNVMAHLMRNRVAVIGKIDNGTIEGNNIVSSLIAIAQVAEEVMGGTSGALYS